LHRHQQRLDLLGGIGSRGEHVFHHQASLLLDLLFGILLQELAGRPSCESQPRAEYDEKNQGKFGEQLQ